MLPWEKDPSFFTRLRRDEKHHYVPKRAVLWRFLEPAEWNESPNRCNHLRELDLRSGSVGWIGVHRPAWKRNLNFVGNFSSERYWGLDDLAMGEAARDLAAGDLESVFVLVPGLAALPIRHPQWQLGFERLLEDAGEATDDGLVKRAIVPFADRVKRDWITAMDRGRVSVLVEVVPEQIPARLVLPDAAVDVRGPTGKSLQRPPWLWWDEWFPDIGEAEPDCYEGLTLAAPISSRVHLTIRAGKPSRNGSQAELRSVDERRIRDLNARAIERAVTKLWAGRKRDLEALSGR